MAAARVVLSDDAQRDLEKIWEYLAHEVSSRIADYVAARLHEVMSREAELPSQHRTRPEYPGHPRRINVFSYAIFFEPLPEGDGILVWRVIRDTRDLPHHIRPPR